MKTGLCLSLMVLVFFTVPLHAQTVSGSVPSPVRELVMDLLQEAGIASARMISRRRSTRQEAEFLYRVLSATDDPASLKQRFGEAGQKVVDAYLAHKPKPRRVILAAMDAVIRNQISLLGDNRTEFAYVGPSKVHKFFVFPEIDVDPATLTWRLEEAMASHPDVVKSSAPVEAGGGFHIEVTKALRTISGLWRGRCRENDQDGESVRYRHVMKLARGKTGYTGARKSPSRDGETWVNSRLRNLKIDRRAKTISYSYQNERGKQIDIAGQFNRDYNRIKFTKNTSGAKCRLRKRF
ncbi:MAG: hypothetical protein VW802_03225 [Rhodospirillaceae bacterium]|jgi:hypothetical protein